MAFQFTSHASVLDSHALSIDAAGGDPAVDAPTVVADLKAIALNRFDEVQVFATIDFAEHNVSDVQFVGVGRFDSAELAGFNSTGHGVAAGAEGDGFTGSESGDMCSGPAQ